jgi:hypothetical protein
MIRHSPAELYIQYLIVHPDGYGDETIVGMLQLKQLDFLSPSYVNRLRRELHPPVPFRPFDKGHRTSLHFLTAHRFYYLFYPDEAMGQAFSILDDPKAKEVMESMLITDDPPGLIAHRMRGAGRLCTTKTIERYRCFFFDTDRVDETEMRALMQLRTDFVDPNSDEYEDQIRGALKKVGFRDARRLVANHPVRPLASLLNQMRMGNLPSTLELSKLAASVRALCMMQAHSAAMIGGSRSAMEARDFMTAANITNELLTNMGTPDADLQRELQKLALQTDVTTPPHIGELSAGAHTVDVQPLSAKEAHDV